MIGSAGLVTDEELARFSPESAIQSVRSPPNGSNQSRRSDCRFLNAECSGTILAVQPLIAFFLQRQEWLQ
jgi:hypothetical protein